MDWFESFCCCQVTRSLSNFKTETKHNLYACFVFPCLKKFQTSLSSYVTVQTVESMLILNIRCQCCFGTHLFNSPASGYIYAAHKIIKGLNNTDENYDLATEKLLKHGNS